MKNINASSSFSLLMLGLFLILLGAFSVASPAVSGSAVVLTIGIIMLLAGISQMVHGFSEKGWKHKTMPLFLGVITTLAGIFVMAHPLVGLKFLTFLLIVFFVAEGLWKIIASFGLRPMPGWASVFFSGLLSLILGMMIWKQWPISGLWAVGILVGVDFLMTGLTMVLLSAYVKHVKPVDKLQQHRV